MKLALDGPDHLIKTVRQYAQQAGAQVRVRPDETEAAPCVLQDHEVANLTNTIEWLRHHGRTRAVLNLQGERLVIRVVDQARKIKRNAVADGNVIFSTVRQIRHGLDHVEQHLGDIACSLKSVLQQEHVPIDRR